MIRTLVSRTQKHACLIPLASSESTNRWK
ncbi:hypothetical protein E2C01_083076 [Portunus trituberculatus]|uniref:Uncharacterized protein n=1 Tax=Portunus trituberculatus TaxID=210409 RepID=A0A5B7ITY7_PORTR|nr:hypothetical protein [Portunus trituberculatus]